MPQASILIAAVIIAGLIGYALGRARGREGATGQGRLTLDSPPTTTKTDLAVPTSSTSSALADTLESLVASMPGAVTPSVQAGAHVSIKTDVTRIFELPSKDLAEAVAERERAKGMSVVVAPPDASGQMWRVTATKSQS
ncbi:MAG TPA: hypothetical protein VFO25_00950 [Candidatus Eremiobacteraceae bacterium]|nr:hypothetical protein [Candidatus Eremiobacteraceae bacterium]